jgi:hypothetical protein
MKVIVIYVAITFIVLFYSEGITGGYQFVKHAKKFIHIISVDNSGEYGTNIH